MFLLVGVRPAANAQEDFEVAVRGFEQGELFDGAVGVFPCVAPRVAGIVDFRVGVAVGQEDGAVVFVVGEGIEEVG